MILWFASLSLSAKQAANEVAEDLFACHVGCADLPCQPTQPNCCGGSIIYDDNKSILPGEGRERGD